MGSLDADIRIRPADPGEEDVVLDLLSDAAEWLRARGIDQWPRRFPLESVAGQIASREALLAVRNGEPVATVCVAESDAELWGPAAAPAYYVSRLAVARSAAGLGVRILAWIEAQAAGTGRRYVRLATARHNPALRAYYERAGYRHVTDPPHAKWPTSLYERTIA